MLSLVLVPAGAAQTPQGCQPGQQPAYVFGFADLHDYLGDAMGEPLTCEFADPNGTGDVHQRTNRGLAFWRKSTNTPTFTNGFDHWGHTSDGWAHWLGDSIDPPGVVPPAATPTPPPASTPTPGEARPTPTPTVVPDITTSKYLDMFRAEGGGVFKNVTTGLPFRRVEASWDNSYRACPPRGPNPDCIRGRIRASTIIGPGATAERLEARAFIYNTFRADRADAQIEADVAWDGRLASVVAADSMTSIEFELVVRDADGREVPGTPFTIVTEQIGPGAIQGVDTLTVQGNRKITVPVKLRPGGSYRIEFQLTCRARASVNLTTTQCYFGGEPRNETNAFFAEWTALRVAFDKGICSASQAGDGCIYRDA
jgi:hypothetical protein